MKGWICVLYLGWFSIGALFGVADLTREGKSVLSFDPIRCGSASSRQIRCVKSEIRTKENLCQTVRYS